MQAVDYSLTTSVKSQLLPNRHLVWDLPMHYILQTNNSVSVVTDTPQYTHFRLSYLLVRLH